MSQITEPTLLLDEQIVRQNIEQMVHRAQANDALLKPHFKTHQSIQIGNWMRDYGIKKITVSSVRMARYFAQAGWDDITIAFPCNVRCARQLDELAQHVRLSILISDTNALPKIKRSLNNNFEVYIEIDSGAGRTGLAPAQPGAIENMISALKVAKNLKFRGFYSHPGHSYQCRSKDDIQRVNRETTDIMRQVKETFNASFPGLVTCMGDTPCCSIGSHFEHIDEWSPGNFVFYDLMQQQIGACGESDIALCLASPVVAKYPKRNTLAIHAGAVHLSKENIEQNYGKVVKLNDNLSWQIPDDYRMVSSISQAHGIVSAGSSLLKRIQAGDLIGILPVHACLTADTMRSYLNISSGKMIDHL